jgi:putative hydrolase of the HAD superfamily
MKKISGIRAISFDADGTLWDFEKVMRYSLGCVLKELQTHDSNAAALLDIDKMIEIRNLLSEELKGKTTNLETIRLESFRKILETIGRSNDILAEHLNKVYLEHRYEDISLFNDVLPTFNKLQKKYTLGLLSNGNSYPDRCGLEGMFQFVVFSQDYGVEKPDPKLFNIAVEKSGYAKSQLLHVGDSLETDVIGAMKIGIKYVWLNRKHMKNDLGLEINYEITSLSELPEILY